MVQQDTPLKVLISASSKSSGGNYLTPFLDGEPLYIRLLSQLRLACTEAREFYMSLRDMSEILRLPPLRGQAKEVAQFMEPPLRYIYTDQNYTLADDSPLAPTGPNKLRGLGPAAALLAAHRLDRTCRWLIVTCDYPLVQSTDIRQLYDSYEAPVTCFRNALGFSEPLLGIWSPESLKVLEDNVKNDIVAPVQVLEALKGNIIQPARKETLSQATNHEEWAEAMTIALRMIIEESESGS